MSWLWRLIAVVSLGHWVTANTTEDIMRNSNILDCLKTNYKESHSDLYAVPYAIPWSVDLPSFTINWPVEWRTLAPTEVKYATTTNVAYIKLKITDNNDRVHYTEPITSSPYKVTGINSVKEIVVYLAPIGFRRNVTIDGFEVHNCIVENIVCLRGLNIFSDQGVVDKINIPILSTIEFAQGGGVKYTGTVELPFLEIDLNCLAVGSSEFLRVEFIQIKNINFAIVKIWNSGFPVTVIDNSGTVTETFDFTRDSSTLKYVTRFETGIRGDKIQVSLVPLKIFDQGTFVTILVQGLSVFTLSLL